MADYPINKGIGHSVEFKGLKAQYLFIFAGGLLAVFFLVVVLYMAGADQLVCIGLGLTLGSLLVWITFHLNNKYGEHGLMKLLAAKSHPRYILNRRKTNRMFKHKKGSPWFAVLMGSVADSVGAKIRYFSDLSTEIGINLYKKRTCAKVFSKNIWLFAKKLVSLQSNLQ